MPSREVKPDSDPFVGQELLDALGQDQASQQGQQHTPLQTHEASFQV